MTTLSHNHSKPFLQDKKLAIMQQHLLIFSVLANNQQSIRTYTWGSKVLHRLFNFIMVDMCQQKMMHKLSLKSELISYKSIMKKPLSVLQNYNISIFYCVTSHCCDFFDATLDRLVHKIQRKIMQFFEQSSNTVILCLRRTEKIII